MSFCQRLKNPSRMFSEDLLHLFLNDRLLPGHQHCPNNPGSPTNTVSGPSSRCSDCGGSSRRCPYHTGPLAQGILVHVFSLVLFSGADLGKAALSSQMPRFIHSVHTEHSEQGGVGMKKTHRLRLRPPSAVGKDTKQSKGNKMLHTGSAGQLVVGVNKTRARTKTLITLFPSAKRQFGGSILVVKE